MSMELNSVTSNIVSFSSTDATEKTKETSEQLAELYQTADELARAFCNFAQALKSYTKGA